MMTPQLTSYIHKVFLHSEIISEHYLAELEFTQEKVHWMSSINNHVNL